MSQLEIRNFNDVTGKHLNTHYFLFLRNFPWKTKHFKHILTEKKHLPLLSLLIYIILLFIINLLL